MYILYSVCTSPNTKQPCNVLTRKSIHEQGRRHLRNESALSLCSCNGPMGALTIKAVAKQSQDMRLVVGFMCSRVSWVSAISWARISRSSRRNVGNNSSLTRIHYQFGVFEVVEDPNPLNTWRSMPSLLYDSARLYFADANNNIWR